MRGTAESNKDKLLKEVAKQAKGKVKGSDARAFQTFLEHYFAHVPPRDVIDQGAENLLGMAASHWKFASKRKPGKALVKAYNPKQGRDGWKSSHSIIAIVNDDMPFLVDSLTAEVNRRGLTVHLVVHPILKVRRTDTGQIRDVVTPGEAEDGARMESWIHLEVDQRDTEQLKDIQQGIEAMLDNVRLAVDDWRPMSERMSSLIDELAHAPQDKLPEEIREVREFARWLHDNNFTFLGFREYKIQGEGNVAKMSVDPKSGLGLLRDPKTPVFERKDGGGSSEAEVASFISGSEMVLVSKTNDRSPVHRPVHMDMISFKRVDTKGRTIGQRVFIGLFTSAAYNRSPRDIPLLRRRLQKVIQQAGLPPSSHDGKALINILETFPRDELFQYAEDELYTTGMGILHLQERQRVALFVRRDTFERFISALIYVPKDKYTTALRERLQDILCEALHGSVAAFHTLLGDAPLARIHLIIKTKPGGIPKYNVEALESTLAHAARSWSDHLADALVEVHGEQTGLKLFDRYQDAFGAGYRDDYAAEKALGDIAIIEDVMAGAPIGLNLYRAVGSQANEVQFKVYHPDSAVPLSDTLPLFEHMGFRVLDENPHEVVLGEGPGPDRIMIHDFGLETKDGGPVDIDAIRDNFHDAFRRVWLGEIESDGFNALVPRGGLTWREVIVLRAYCKCLRQMGIPYSQVYMEQTLAKHLDLTRLIIKLFMTRFDPEGPKDREKPSKGLLDKLTAGLEAVTSADEDRILSRFINVVTATLRTNFFQPMADGAHKAYVSFKIASREVEELPLPRPLREIFVYSPRVEGVHLRFGFVARGGLRWSDRLEDFRTEILGLVKAQQVKNAVIVPVGSKGGFVVKRPPVGGGRDAFMEEGINCYKIFISGLLDITDNLKGKKVIPPKQVVRRDNDDPYLVVAADKGTATFSDIANGVSIDYGHWLGDAFASGGSQGYDHKAMGITAKGAWESVKRHFREMGHDTQTQDFTVAGVGDMSGDVFGNGMLLSKHIKLVAAFNHLHIFIDPDPDPAKSYAERDRMFKLSRSTWADYDQKTLSKGGGIYPRDAKSIKLSKEAVAALGLAKDTMTPNELMQAILTSSVDLLWFGGIGTYIKAADEAHTDVGDRANDAIRINGANLKCRVIGEGANLGATQRGRIEYALKGGHLNTDSIDNSAGVDCSDHEVNIKILIDSAVAAGKMSEKQRNSLLAKMTDEVSSLVLKHNYDQTQAITSIHVKGAHTLDNQVRLMRMLEKQDRLNRGVEFLPDDETLADRATKKIGLTRPELSVLIAYSKIWLYDQLLQSDFPDDPYLLSELVAYFPSDLREKFRNAIEGHRLRREIIATRATNSMVNRVGDTFVTEFMEKTGRSAPEIAKAYVIARHVLRARELWKEIEALDNKVPSFAQTSMLADINHMIEWVTLWFLRSGSAGLDISSHVDEFAAGMARLADNLSTVVPPHYVNDMKGRAQPYVADGVSKSLAYRVAHLVNLYSGPDIVRLANKRKMDVCEVAKVYFAIGTHFRLGRLRAAAERLQTDDHWQQLAAAAVVEDLYSHQLILASNALDEQKKGADAGSAVAAWIAKYKEPVEQTDLLLNELWATEVNDLSMVQVASRRLRALADTQI